VGSLWPIWGHPFPFNPQTNKNCFFPFSLERKERKGKERKGKVEGQLG
jgi:hypothetical protein